MSGYAVIDIETTGLSPRYHHRIVEIAVVHVDEHGRIESAWETLVDPMRDLGPQHIHGVTAADASQAPTFHDIAPALIDLLRGRTVVAHNSRFDLWFLCAEFERAGIPVPIGEDAALCTMRLAEILLPGSGRALADCCAAFDIDLVDAHEALSDARATAQLLGAYLRAAPTYPLWEQWAAFAASLVWPQVVSSGRADWITRNRGTRSERTFLDRMAAQLPAWTTPIADVRTETDYLAVLDRALSDGFLSIDEAEELHGIADALGLSLWTRHELHRRYFDGITAAVWADGMLTSAEADEVRALGRMLDIPATVVATALEPTLTTGPILLAAHTRPAAAPADPGELAPGSLVVLTGQMSRGREEYEAALVVAGFVVHGAVTERVALVIAADVDSLSGKARKARDYGIPVVGEEWFSRQLRLAG